MRKAGVFEPTSWKLFEVRMTCWLVVVAEEVGGVLASVDTRPDLLHTNRACCISVSVRVVETAESRGGQQGGGDGGGGDAHLGNRIRGAYGWAKAANLRLWRRPSNEELTCNSMVNVLDLVEGDLYVE
ncbi:unnamed protein product [Mesocestoides corti]|uniref:Uncharacterized protein n=1 Tax=Mesocestoides corti TaxID=53468 RepID=A0A0R3UCA6_MESCO|nr:unnamed protein product [Mesocestoides corti]